MAAGTPTASPIERRSRTSFITNQITPPRRAPRAIRTPISLARAFIGGIGNHSDDLDIELRSRCVSSADMAADGAFIPEIVLGKAVVDDRDFGIFDEVARVEIAAFENGRPHGREVAGRERVH